MVHIVSSGLPHLIVSFGTRRLRVTKCRSAHTRKQRDSQHAPLRGRVAGAQARAAVVPRPVNYHMLRTLA